MLHTNSHGEADRHSYDESPRKLCFYTVECDVMQCSKNVLPYGAKLGFYLQGNCFVLNIIQHISEYENSLPYLADRHHYEWLHARTWIKIILLAKPWIYHINDVINGERCFCNISCQYHLKQIPNRQQMTAQSPVCSPLHYCFNIHCCELQSNYYFEQRRKAYLLSFLRYLELNLVNHLNAIVYPSKDMVFAFKTKKN